MKEYTIDEYRDKMLRAAQETLPKESKQLLKTEAQKLRRYLVSYSNRNVPISEIDEGADHRKYHRSFKTGKTYVFNEALSKRVFNNSGHGKYVESGRKIAKGYKKKNGYAKEFGKGRTTAYDVYKNVKIEFDPVYKQDLTNWIDKMIGEGKL